MHGTATTPYGYTAKWRGPKGLVQRGTVLSDAVGATNVDLQDGHVLMCDGVVLAVAANLLVCQYDGWAYDPRTGYSLAWYGKDMPWPVAKTLPTLEFEDGCEVVFAKRGIGTTGPLGPGQLQFACTQPRSLPRSTTKARRFGFYGQRTGLYLWERPRQEVE